MSKSARAHANKASVGEKASKAREQTKERTYGALRDRNAFHPLRVLPLRAVAVQPRRRIVAEKARVHHAWGVGHGHSNSL